MYLPLVRGKQFELVALRELANVIPKGLFKPIIEPVRENYSPLIKTIQILNEQGVEPILIINPSLGNFKQLNGFIDDVILKIDPKIKFVPCIKTKQHDTEIERKFKSIRTAKAIYVYDKIDSQNISLLNEADFSIVPADAPVGALNSISNIVLMDDPFQKQKKNADYDSESYFSELHISYQNKASNVIGFGDYTIVGSDYSESGGPAYVVTIHMSYIDRENFDAMSVKHFSSFDNSSLVDPGGKFLEALDKFYVFQNNNQNIFDDTIGKIELINLYHRKQYPGLGVVKKLCIEHHIQTICNYLV
ncbi:sce7725 family protein [Pseudescherichia vulneris]